MSLPFACYVRVPRDLSSVESIDRRAEVDPRDVGLPAGAADEIWRAARSLYRTGVHPSFSLCIRHRGQVIVQRAIGHARGNAPGDPKDGPRVPATPDTLYCLYSASKAVTAMLVHILDDRGLLHIDDRVAEYIPEFGAHGKERITLRHVLSHRAGIPVVPPEYAKIEYLTDTDFILEKLCEAKPEYQAGRRLGYHPLTGGFLFGEIVRRVTGKSIREVLAETVLDPLGFEHHNYGVAPHLVQTVAQNASTGIAPPRPIQNMFRRALGVTMEEAAAVSNDERFLTGIVPSGNIVATAAEAARFFQLLLNGGELDGVRIFEPRTLHRATQETSHWEADGIIGLPIRYGLGFMLGADVLSLYGHSTPRAFGHLGFTHLLAWADPDRELAVALLTAGKPFAGAFLVPHYRLLTTINRVCGPEVA